MSNYHLSRFAHFLTKENLVCAYNALTMQSCYFSNEEYNKILTFLSSEVILPDAFSNKELCASLIENRIIVDGNTDDRHLNIIKQKAFDGVTIRVMIIHLTDFCNLKCKYCFIEGGINEQYKRQNMTIKTIEKAIDKFFSILKQYKKEATPSIVFYGGEPLCNWDVMLHALRYIDEKKERDVDKILITNATLFTPTIAAELNKYDVHVSISLDGDECNNMNRIFHDNTPSFSEIIRGLEILRDASITPSISCVLSKENVSNHEQILRFFVEELRIKALGFNHVSIVPNLTYYDETYENKFADALIGVQEIIQSEYGDVYERRMNHKINCFLDKQLLRADCTGCGEQMSVSPNGEIGICQGYMGSRKTFNGTVFEDDYLPKDDPAFIEWSQRSPLTIESCLKCVALATCGGGCPRNADMLNGSIWNVDTAFCHFAKKAQEWMLWKQAEGKTI